MSSIQQTLAQLLQFSKKASEFQLNQGSIEIADTLIERKRKLVRDPDPTEVQIAATCTGDDSLLQKFRADLQSNPTSSKREDIERILSSAKALNQICNDEDLQIRIEELEQNHDDKQFNLGFLQGKLSSNQAEIDRITQSNTEQNMMNIDDSGELREEELAIQRLEVDLQQKRQKNKEIRKRKQEHISMERTINALAAQQRLQLQASKTSDDRLLKSVQDLEQKIAAKKQLIIEYDVMLESLEVDRAAANNTFGGPTTSHHQNASTREVYAGFRARIEKLLNNPPGDEPSSNVIELLSTLESIETELRDILSRLDTVEEAENHIEMSKSIYYQLLTYIHNRVLNGDSGEQAINMEEFDELFPHNKHGTVTELNLPKETLFSTSILLKLHNEGQAKKANLIPFLEDFAKENNLPTDQAEPAIYKLAASHLINIDTSHKDIPVELNLTSLKL